MSTSSTFIFTDPYSDAFTEVIAQPPSTILDTAHIDFTEPLFGEVLTSAAIGAAITGIMSSVFQNRTSLTEVTFGPNSELLAISHFLFYGCAALTAITIPESVTDIQLAAFSGCTKLTSVEGMEGVITIGNDAFFGCNKLTLITIPESVTTIQRYAFSKCSDLTSVSGMEGVTSISDGAFAYCPSLTAITIPEKVTIIDISTFNGCNKLTSIEGMEGVDVIRGSAFFGCNKLTAITLPEGLTTIGNAAFKECWSLKSMTFPKSLTTIGADAFLGSGLNKVTLYYGNIFHKSPAKNVMFGGAIVDIIIIGAPRLQVLPMIFSIENGPPLGDYHRPNSGHGTPGGVACKRHVKNRT